MTSLGCCIDEELYKVINYLREVWGVLAHRIYPDKNLLRDKLKVLTSSVKIVVYIRGGMCIDVVTNLPDDSVEYSVVDYDNEPDLPDDFNPFDDMNPLPDIGALLSAARKVIDNWETGDLASAVQELNRTLNHTNF